MIRTLTVLLAAVLLAGCSLMRRGEKEPEPEIPSRSGDSSQAMSLPGVPLNFMPPPEKPKYAAKRAPAPAPAPGPAEEDAPPARTEAAPAAPAPAATADSGDLDYHIAAAKKYALRKKYLSAAAEYGAAVPFVPAGDARAVQLLERQGAMLLRGGNEAKAQDAFKAAIAKAEDLKTSGPDLGNAYLGLGYCQEKAGKVKDAIKTYEKALELAPRKAKAKISQTIADLKSKK